jgi:hypothetical protein
MSNQIDHRQPESRRNKRRRELPLASSSAGEGHNGQKGRSKWNALSRRSERHAAGKRIPKVSKRSRPIVTD